jgi:hypothetical protein
MYLLSAILIATLPDCLSHSSIPTTFFLPLCSLALTVVATITLYPHGLGFGLFSILAGGLILSFKPLRYLIILISYYLSRRRAQ